jgi:hypothetical protein
LRLPASSVTVARQPISSHSRSNTSAGPIRRTAISNAASLLADQHPSSTLDRLRGASFKSIGARRPSTSFF